MDPRKDREGHLERFIVNQRSIYFHLEQLIGRSLFDVATSRKAVLNALLQISIPDSLWKLLEYCFFGLEPRSKEALERLADNVYDEVLVHNVLSLPRPRQWETIASDLAEDLSREKIKEIFWKNVREKNIPIDDAVRSLWRVGYYGSDLGIVFE